MMAGNRQVGEEERPLPRGVSIHASMRVDRGRLVDAEARFMIAADVARVLKRLVAAIADDRLHAQIGEAPRVKERGAVPARREHGRDRRDRERSP